MLAEKFLNLLQSISLNGTKNDANNALNSLPQNKKQSEKYLAQEKYRTKAKQSITDGIFRKKKTNAS